MSAQKDTGSIQICFSSTMILDMSEVIWRRSQGPRKGCILFVLVALVITPVVTVVTAVTVVTIVTVVTVVLGLHCSKFQLVHQSQLA